MTLSLEIRCENCAKRSKETWYAWVIKTNIKFSQHFISLKEWFQQQTEFISMNKCLSSHSGGKTGVITREIVCRPCERLSIATWNSRLTTKKFHLRDISIITWVIILRQLFASGSWILVNIHQYSLRLRRIIILVTHKITFKLNRSPRNPENSSLLKQKNTSSKYGQEEYFSVIQAVATLKVTDVKKIKSSTRLSRLEMKQNRLSDKTRLGRASLGNASQKKGKALSHLN